MTPYGFLRRYVIHPLQALGVAVVYGLFRVLPLDAASAIGGWLARTVGPRTPFSARARRNLRIAFPDRPEAELARIERGMWDNLGRMVGEFPHLDELDGGAAGTSGRVTTVGGEHIVAVRDDGLPGIFFSAHLGNWEIVSLAATLRGVPLDRIYRAANNPLLEWIYRRGRKAVAGELIPKGPQGARRLLRILKEGRHLGMLVDQKMNDGIPVPFFGRPAWTAPALVDLALRFDCPVVPARVTRLGGARFRLDVLPPMKLTSNGDRHADIVINLTAVNALIESWVRETPEQWLWLHNRWPKDEAPPEA